MIKGFTVINLFAFALLFFLAINSYAGNLSGTMSKYGILYENSVGNVTPENSTNSVTIGGQIIATSNVDYVFILPTPDLGSFGTLQLRINGNNLAWNGVNVKVFNKNNGQFQTLYLHNYNGWSTQWYNIDPNGLPLSYDGYSVYTALQIRLETPGFFDGFRAYTLQLSFSFNSPYMTDNDLKTYYASIGAIHQCIKASQAVREFDLWPYDNFDGLVKSRKPPPP